MNSLRFLHIASFSGNIGDNANHIGFRNWMEGLSAHKIEWTNLEIRQFFWGEREWDADFVSYANSFDALVIGGGNYFELWVEKSPTGTSIAITPEHWSRLSVPVYFNALGVDPGQGVPTVCRRRFTAFLETILSDAKILVSVRNDGAKANLRDHIGTTQAEAVLHAPDNGFFAGFAPATSIPYFSDPNVNRVVAINLASDMAEIRFAKLEKGTDSFAAEFAHALNDLLERDASLGFMFMPHIFRDLDVASRVIDSLPDRMRRTRIAQAPYGTGDGAAATIFGLYAASDVCVGMRFHANVVPLGNLRQTIGLVCYPQISALYAEMGQSDRCVDVSIKGFGESLANKIIGALDHPHTAFSGTPLQAFTSALALRDEITPRVRTWLENL